MSLTTRHDVARACRSFARRWGGLDPENAYGEAMLAIVRAERAGPAISADRVLAVARTRLRNAMRAEIADRVRLTLYGRWRAAIVRPRGDTADVPEYLARLTPREREAVGLRLWEGLSEAECGARMGCSPNTATVHYHGAIRRLRRLFDG